MLSFAVIIFEDVLITKVLEDECSDEKELDLETFTLIEHINDVRIMSHTLLKHINQISDDELALHLIRTVLLHDKANEQLPLDEMEQLQKYLTDITLYANIGRANTMTELLPCDTWTKVMEINRVKPGRLLYSLIERNQYEICFQFKWIRFETQLSSHNLSIYLWAEFKTTAIRKIAILSKYAK